MVQKVRCHTRYDRFFFLTRKQAIEKECEFFLPRVRQGVRS